MNIKNQSGFGKIIIGTLFCLTAVLFLNAGTGGEAGEKEKIISVVNQFFAVLASRSVEDAREILVPEGAAFSLREKDNQTLLRFTAFQDLIKSLAESKKNYKEVMTNPTVLIHNTIAVVWAEYKFYIDGEFSHCGVDAFNLVKTNNAWKISGIIYTVEPTGCNQ